MNRADFVNVAEEALESLPEEFRSRIKNVAILVEDFPPKQSPPPAGAATAIAPRHLSRRASHQEERF